MYNPKEFCPVVHGYLVTCHSCGERHIAHDFCDCYINLLRQVFNNRDARIKAK